MFTKYGDGKILTLVKTEELTDEQKKTVKEKDKDIKEDKKDNN